MIKSSVRWIASVSFITVLGLAGCGDGDPADPIVVPPKPATALTLTTAPSATVANRVALAAQPVIQIVNADGAAVAQAGTLVTASLAAGTGTLGGTTTVATDATGKAAFTGLVISGTAGPKTLTFSAPSLTSVTSTVTLTAGAATTVALNGGSAQTAAAGSTLATPPSVKVTDADGNPVAGVPVVFAVTGGGGTIAGGSTLTDANGIARPTSWTLGPVAGTNTVIVAAAGLTGSPLTFTATGTPGTPALLQKISGENQTATTGSAVTIPPSVQLTDINGNVISGATITFAVASGGGSVTGATQTTNATGIATVGSWTLGPAAGANTLTASSPGVPAVTFTASAVSAAARLGVTSAPTTAQDRITFATPVVVQIQSATGTPVAQAGVPVTVAITSGGGTLSGTTTATTDATGKATFSDLSIAGTAGQRVLTFSANGLTSATTAITLGAGTATAIAINAGQGQSAQVGTAVATPPAVKVTDQDGNPVAGVPVTFTVSSGGGSVVAGNVVTDANGIARPASWTLGPVAGANTLTATSPGLTGSPITFTATGTAAAGTTLTKLGGDNQTALAGTAVPISPSVKLTDASGNAVAGAAVTFTVTGGNGTVTGAVQTTDAAGVATVTSWTLDAIPGNNTLIATATGVPAVTFTATGTATVPPPPGSLAVTFCVPSQILWVGYQNGAGAVWTQATANTDGSYTVPITGSGGVSWVTQVAGSTARSGYFQHEFLYATRSEIAAMGCLGGVKFDRNNTQLGTRDITGTVSGLTANQQARITFGSTVAGVVGATAFTLNQAPDGAHDLIAGRAIVSSTEYTPDRFVVRRNATGPVLADINFTGAESQAAVSGVYTINGLNNEPWEARSEALTANGTKAVLSSLVVTSARGAVASPYQGLPTSLQSATDLYRFIGVASGTDTQRGIKQNFTTATTRSATLGGLLSVPEITLIAASPYIRHAVELLSQSEYAAYMFAAFNQAGDGVRDLYVTITAGYTGGTPGTWQFIEPDLSTVGFLPQWGMQGTFGAISSHVEAGSHFAISRTDQAVNLFAARVQQ